MELSTTSNTRWCRPRSAVSPMYIPGRFRTASRPSRTLMFSAPYSDCGGVSVDPVAIREKTQIYTPTGHETPPERRTSRPWIRTSNELCQLASETHRHQDVRVARVLRAPDDAWPDLVGETHIDRVTRRVRIQDLDQVFAVEPDGDRVTGVRDLEILARLTGIWIASGKLERAGLEV